MRSKCIRARPEVWGTVSLGECGDKWSSWVFKYKSSKKPYPYRIYVWGSKNWNKKVWLTSKSGSIWLRAQKKKNPWDESWPAWKLID
jgi:hypothetical protein